MNIPASTIEPFGFIGMPQIKLPITRRYANRQLDICIDRIKRWLNTGNYRGLTNQQIRNHIVADLLHDGRDEWLTVTVIYAQRDTVKLHLTHRKENVSRNILLRIEP